MVKGASKQKKTNSKHDKQYKNKQRTLVLTSRSCPARFRHLVVDMRDLLPHSKKENKLGSKTNLIVINDLCEMKRCNNCVYFETRKKQDLYMWVSRCPNGPSAKFLVQNLHTMAEAKLIGNCLRGSRPLLFFDKTFDTEPAYQLIKELFTQVFGTPKGHPKSKPFIDHVFSFIITDGRIWFRSYQIVETTVASGEKETKRNDLVLVEIGPRFVLNPIRLFGGSFGGATMWKNADYVAPRINRRRRIQQEKEKLQYKNKIGQKAQRKRHLAKHPIVDSMADVFDDNLTDVFSKAD